MSDDNIKPFDLAFPFVSHGGFHEHQECQPGLTKREHFAAMMLQGLISGQEFHYRTDKGFGYTPEAQMARDAVSFADALLAELAKGAKTHD